jgi:hypothetical protein
MAWPVRAHRSYPPFVGTGVGEKIGCAPGDWGDAVLIASLIAEIGGY